MQSRILRGLVLPAGLLILILGAIVTHEVMRKEPAIAGEATTDRVLLNYPMEHNFRQSLNSCGPYSVAAALRVLGDTQISSEEIASSIAWRYPNGPTLPWGIESALRERDVSATSYTLESFTDDEKVTFLQEQVNAGSPVIILGAYNSNFRTQHYVTVVGYDKTGEFYVYDSAHTKNPDNENMTADDNGNPPGNRTFTNAELLEFWSKGGVLDIYNYYAVVASK